MAAIQYTSSGPLAIGERVQRVPADRLVPARDAEVSDQQRTVEQPLPRLAPVCYDEMLSAVADEAAAHADGAGRVQLDWTITVLAATRPSGRKGARPNCSSRSPGSCFVCEGCSSTSGCS
jgi:hypothetical protein